MGDSSQTVVVGYKYLLNVLFGVCHGKVNAITKIMVDGKTAWEGDVTGATPTASVAAPRLFGGDGNTGEGGYVGTLYLGNGAISPWMKSLVQSGLGQPSPNYAGITSLLFSGPGVRLRAQSPFGGTVPAGQSQKFYFGNSPYPKSPAIQVLRTTEGWHDDTPWYPEKAEVPPLIDDGVWEYQIIGSPADPRTTVPDLDNPGIPTSGWIAGGVGPWGFRGPGTDPWPTGQTEPNIKWIGRSQLWLRKTISVASNTRIRLNWTVENSAFAFLNGEFVGGHNITNVQPLPGADPAEPLDIELPAGTHTLVVLGLDEAGDSETGNYTYLDVPVESRAIDMNPAHIVYQALTDPSWGMGYPTSDIDSTSFTAVADTLHAERFGLSLGWFGQQSIEEFVQLVLSHVNGVLRLAPSTGKFTLKLLRDDYDIDAIPVLNTTNAVLEGFSRASWGDLANEITINYEDHDGKEQSITVQSLAAIAAQGGVVQKTINYPGISDAQLAARVAQRELVQASTLIAQVTLNCNRSVVLAPGDVFKLEWPTLGIGALAMRVVSVDRGTLQDGMVKVQAVEDIFGIPDTSYISAQVPQAPPLRSDAVDLQTVLTMEVPYYTAATEASQADRVSRTPDSCYARVLAVRPNSTYLNFLTGQSDDGTNFAEIGTGQFSAAVTSVGPHGRLATDITIALVGNDLPLAPGDYCDWNGEIVRVDAIDYDNDTITVGRGCLDTLPIEHADGEYLIAINGFGATDTTERTEGQTSYYKALPATPYDRLDAADATAHSITFENRLERPYPPGKIQINGEYYPASITGPLVVSWAHRDRIQQTAGVIDFTEDSIGPEAGTTYTIRFYDGNDSLVRTVTGHSSTSYTWDTEIDDAGGVAGAKVSALLNFNGTNASTEFVDQTGKAWTRFGNAQISTAESKWGGASGLFDGTGDYLTTPHHDDFNVTVGDFTVEAWVRFTGSVDNTVIVTKRAPSGNDGGWQLGVHSTTKFQMAAWDTSGTVINIHGATTPAINTWYHVAATKSGTTWRLFVDGVLDASGTQTAAPTANTRQVIIGRHAQNTTFDMQGYIDDLRIIKGKALYTAAFTPPLAQFVMPRAVSLLNFDGSNGSTTFADAAGLTWSASGNAQISTAQSKFGGSSVYFDGSGDRLGAPNLGIGGAEEFAVEFWMRPGQVAAGCVVVDLCPASGRGFLITQPDADPTSVAVYVGDSSDVAYEVTLNSATGVLATNAWTHVAVSRELDTFRLFINGTLAQSATWTGSVDWSTTCYIGNNAANTSGYTGYIDAWRVTRGEAVYTATFPTPASAPTMPQTVSLLNFNGINTSTNIIDGAFPRTWTVNGNAQISTAQSKWGGSSLLLDGTGDFVTTPFVRAFLPDEDFAIEAWVRPSNVSSIRVIASSATSGNAINWILVQNASGGVEWLVYATPSGTSVNIASGAGVLTLNTWHHVAATREGNTWRLFVDGVQVATGTHTGTLRSDANLVYIGRQPNNTARDWNGYIDDFRVTKGRARYTANFTPPSSQLEMSFGAYLPTVRVKLKAVRDGLDSWQEFDWTVTRA